MNDNLIRILIVIATILVCLFIDYLVNHCPKCRRWHYFGSGLIILDKPCEINGKELAKCKKCGHEWKKKEKHRDHPGLGG